MGKLIEVRDLWFAKGGSSILKGINFEVEEGKIYTVLGPNGAGKSTLFRCLLGIWKAEKGEILLDGRKLYNIPPQEKARLISFVPQEHIPTFSFTVLEFVAMGFAPYLSILQAPSKRDYEKAEEVLREFNLARLKDVPYTDISGGEGRLLLIARALMQNTPLLILDEPTSHLDYHNQTLILQKIRELVYKTKKTILMSMHDPTFASLYSDVVILLKGGEIKHMGTPEQVLTEANLSSVYEMSLKVISVDGFRLVYPSLQIVEGRS
jgi:iron complex transport system ATP-binding protein